MPRTVIVTGASLGVGKVVAQAFVAAGDHVVITARTASTLAEAA
jgi:short-subunit dehydrogenase